MNRVLVTGFEPFGGEAINPSWEVAQRLHGAVIGDAQVRAVCLPCAFDAALPALDEALRRAKPACVIALGLAGSRSAVSVERVAVNLIDARIPDNQGAQPVDVPVQAGGAAARFSTLPVKAVVQALAQVGIAAELSMSAGAFVCNQVFYGLMQRLARRRGCRGGFIHLPPLPQQASAHAGAVPMALEQQVRAVRIAIETTLTVTQDLALPGGRID